MTPFSVPYQSYCIHIGTLPDLAPEEALSSMNPPVVLPVPTTDSEKNRELSAEINKEINRSMSRENMNNDLKRDLKRDVNKDVNRDVNKLNGNRGLSPELTAVSLTGDSDAHVEARDASFSTAHSSPHKKLNETNERNDERNNETFVEYNEFGIENEFQEGKIWFDSPGSVQEIHANRIKNRSNGSLNNLSNFSSNSLNSKSNNSIQNSINEKYAEIYAEKSNENNHRKNEKHGKHSPFNASGRLSLNLSSPNPAAPLNPSSHKVDHSTPVSPSHGTPYVTSQTVSPMKSPMRLIAPKKGRWNIDAATQTDETFRDYRRKGQKSTCGCKTM